MQDWSVTFPEEFLARRGYDIFPYLPAVTGRLVVDSNITERFLWDFSMLLSRVLMIVDLRGHNSISQGRLMVS